MNRRSPIAQIFTVLCVLALFGMQSFGVVLGYVCRCGGQQTFTTVDHCHGPHTAKCHHDQEDAKAHQQGEGSDSNRTDHEQVREDAQSRLTEAAPQVIAPQVLLAILPLEEILFASREIQVPASSAVEWGESPPLGVTVARTIVLLI